jgi:hypothetical protein
MSIDKYYIDCVRKRKIETNNSRQRAITTYTDTNIRGYKSWYRQIVSRVAGQDTIVNQYKFLCNDFDLQAMDIIYYEGSYYKVVNDPKNTAHKSHHIKAILRKVENITV